MPDTTAPATGAMQDILTLAAIERHGWEQRLASLQQAGVPLNADDAGGSGDGGDGGQGGSGEGGSGAAATTDTGADDAALGEAGKAALKAERDARKAAEKSARDAQARIDEFEQRDMTEQQKLEKRATEAESKLPTLEAENLRLRVALKKNVPAELIDRLKGSTEKEIEDDADALLKLVKGTGTSSGFDGGARGDAPVSDMDTLIRQKAGFA